MTGRFSLDFFSTRPHATDGTEVGQLNVELTETETFTRTPTHPGGPSDPETARETSRARTPHTIYVPKHYMQNYAYPLIVWLHGAGSSERELLDVMPKISQRNYLGISLRGTSPANCVFPVGYRWSQSVRTVSHFADELHDAVRRFRRGFHVHSERVYLVGFDEGATMAFRLLLSRPEWFAGAAALGGRFPQMQHPLARFCDLQGKRVLIGAGSRDSNVSVADVVKATRLLHTAGVNVSARHYDAAHEVTGKMLAEVNQWIMDGISTSAA